MGEVRVNMNTPAVAREIMRRGGFVDRDMRRRAGRVERLAFRLAPKKTGRLALGIRVERNRHPNGRFDFGYSVVSTAEHSGYVHDGTAAHVVHVRRKKVLSDPQRNTFGKYARIPAIKGRPYMTKALRAALKDG